MAQEIKLTKRNWLIKVVYSAAGTPGSIYM